MPGEIVANAEASRIGKYFLMGFPTVALAVVLAKVNFAGNFYEVIDYYGRDMGWPFRYRDYFHRELDDTTPWKIPILAVDFFVASAMLASVFALMKRLCRDWPKFNLSTMFVATTLMVIIIWLTKYWATIGQILRILTGLKMGWSLYGESWPDRAPLMFGSAALCYGTVWLTFICCRFLYHIILNQVQPKNQRMEPDRIDLSET